MNPLDIIIWAVAIGLAWAALSFFIPFDRMGNLLNLRQTRIKALENRVAALERKLNEKPAPADQTD